MKWEQNFATFRPPNLTAMFAVRHVCCCYVATFGHMLGRTGRATCKVNEARWNTKHFKPNTARVWTRVLQVCCWPCYQLDHGDTCTARHAYINIASEYLSQRFIDVWLGYKKNLPRVLYSARLTLNCVLSSLYFQLCTLMQSWSCSDTSCVILKHYTGFTVFTVI